MASRKTAGKAQAKTAVPTSDAVEQKVIALAEQIGWLLGTVRGKADGLLANEAVQQEVARIRDSATELMEHVNRAGATAKQKAAGAINTAIDAAPGVVASSRKAVASAGTSAKQMAVSASKSAKKVVASASEAARKATKAAQPVVVAVAKPTRGAVDAPGKRHRKPPPQVKFTPAMKRMGEPTGKQAGQKQFQPGHGARRG